MIRISTLLKSSSYSYSIIIQVHSLSQIYQIVFELQHFYIKFSYHAAASTEEQTFMSCLLANIRTPACLRSYSKRKKEIRNRDKAVHSCNWRALLLTIRQLCFFQFTEEVPVSLNEMIMSMQR